MLVHVVIDITVPIRIIWHGVWPVTARTKFWIRHAPGTSVTRPNKGEILAKNQPKLSNKSKFLQNFTCHHRQTWMWPMTSTNFGVVKRVCDPWPPNNSNWYSIEIRTARRVFGFIYVPSLCSLNSQMVRSPDQNRPELGRVKLQRGGDMANENSRTSLQSMVLALKEDFSDKQRLWVLVQPFLTGIASYLP